MLRSRNKKGGGLFMENSNQVKEKQWSDYRDEIIIRSTIPFAACINNAIVRLPGTFYHCTDNIYLTELDKDKLSIQISNLSLACSQSPCFYKKLKASIEKYISTEGWPTNPYSDFVSLLSNFINNSSDEELHLFYSIIAVQFSEIVQLQKESFFHRLNYDYLFFTQGPTNINLHYESYPKAILFLDHNRSQYFVNQNENQNAELLLIKNIDTLTNFSRYMTVMFYNHNFLNSNEPPSDKEIDFWIALDSIIVDNSQKDYISQIMNAEENDLNETQKALKNKLTNTNFRDYIIRLVADKCNLPDENTTIEAKVVSVSDSQTNKITNTCSININRYHFEHIMHTPFGALNEKEQEFKQNFFQTAKDRQNCTKIEFKSEEPSIVIPKRNDNSVLGALSILHHPEKIVSQTKYVPTRNEAKKNISEVASEEFCNECQKKLDERIGNLDMDKKLVEFENAHVDSKYWHLAHKIDKFVTEGSDNLPSEEIINEICNSVDGPKFVKSILSSNHLSSLKKDLLLFQTSKLKHSGFLKHFITGKFNNLCSDETIKDELVSKVVEKINDYGTEPKKQKELLELIHYSEKIKPNQIKIKVFEKLRESYQLIEGNFFTKAFARNSELGYKVVEFNQENCQLVLQKTLKRYKSNGNPNDKINFSKVRRLFIKIIKDPKTKPQVKNFFNEIIKDENFNQLQDRNLNLNLQTFVQTILNKPQQQETQTNSSQTPQPTQQPR